VRILWQYNYLRDPGNPDVELCPVEAALQRAYVMKVRERYVGENVGERKDLRSSPRG